MSEVRKLNSFPVVSSLGSGSYLLATDGSGNGRRITVGNANGNSVAYSTSADMGSGTWVRICQVGGESSCMVFINHRYNNNASKGLILFYMGCHSSEPENMMVYALGSIARFPSARIVHSPSGYYLELLVKSLREGDYLRIATSGYFATPMKDFTLGSVPEGYKVKEFDLSASLIGGVKH